MTKPNTVGEIITPETKPKRKKIVDFKIIWDYFEYKEKISEIIKNANNKAIKTIPEIKPTKNNFKGLFIVYIASYQYILEIIHGLRESWR